jgi:hypothetical protein
MKYAGIGSRKTPEEMRPIIQEIATRLDRMGAVLRSGGAKGADSMFESCASRRTREIFLPDDSDDGIPFGSLSQDVQDAAMLMAKRYHPNWNALGRYGVLCMARNSLQIFGREMCVEDKVDFVVCWTPNGDDSSGGTSQALRIAKAYKIPIFNLGKPDALEKLNNFLNRYKNED